MIDVEQCRVVGIQIRTNLGMYARWSLAALAGVRVVAVHAVHVCRRSAQIAKVALEVGHRDDLAHLLQDVLLRAASDELPLMSRDGAEGTSAETPAMNVHRELNHLVGGNSFAAILGVGESCVGQVEGRIELGSRHRGIGRIHDNIQVADGLQQSVGMHHVRLLFDVSEILGLRPLVAQTFFVAVQHDVAVGDVALDASFRS